MVFSVVRLVSQTTRRNAHFYYIGGYGIREILNTYPEATRSTDGEYDKTVECLRNHFKEKTNMLKTRQNFISLSPQQNETVGHFITRLKTVAEDCEYSDEKDNQIRDSDMFYR